MENHSLRRWGGGIGARRLRRFKPRMPQRAENTEAPPLSEREAA